MQERNWLFFYSCSKMQPITVKIMQYLATFQMIYTWAFNEDCCMAENMPLVHNCHLIIKWCYQKLFRIIFSLFIINMKQFISNIYPCVFPTTKLL